nr:immunoglobulin heavy chain junction region [Macaca mulatta]MOX91655.1 immunoglobulin heavy chain junction region [Macaca mulatta]MOX91986.1 immunoglobulin heavy chain junction region [Macaca mulatta]MOX92000.1 immunoglobulin heavy chain junction region [Macaca mulatta]MOX92331.1 immunoglobulin heavy chain junction region [Macaca mulatta]
CARLPSYCSGLYCFGDYFFDYW